MTDSVPLMLGSSYPSYYNSVPQLARNTYTNHTTTTTTERPIPKQHVAINITPNVYTKHVTQPPTVTTKGPVTHPLHLKLYNHVHHRLQNHNPFMRDGFFDAYVNPDRYTLRTDIFGKDLPTTHFNADLYIPSDLHWGTMYEDVLGTMKLFNMTKDRPITWHEFLVQEPEDILEWQSKFPGILHEPEERLDFKVLFQLKLDDDTTSLTPVELLRAFSGKNAGVTDINISQELLAQILTNNQIRDQQSIIPHFISIVELHSNLPVPVSLQLQSKNADGRNTDWFRSDTLTAKGLVGPVVYPNTHRSTETEVFELSPVAREALFFRWINTNRAQLDIELNASMTGDFYSLRTPDIDTERTKIITGKVSDYIERDDEGRVIIDYKPKELDENGKPIKLDGTEEDIIELIQPTRSEWQSHPSFIHAPNLASFIALDEWKRLQDIRIQLKKSQDQCYVDLTEKRFVVHKDIMDKIIGEKFEGPMDPCNHVMKTDKPLQMRMSLMNPTVNGRNDLESVLRNLHPTVDFPTQSTLSSTLPQGLTKKTNNNGPACYSLSVLVRIQCARLESGTVYR